MKHHACFWTPPGSHCSPFGYTCDNILPPDFFTAVLSHVTSMSRLPPVDKFLVIFALVVHQSLSSVNLLSPVVVPHPHLNSVTSATPRWPSLRLGRMPTQQHITFGPPLQRGLVQCSSLQPFLPPLNTSATFLSPFVFSSSPSSVIKISPSLFAGTLQPIWTLRQQLSNPGSPKVTASNTPAAPPGPYYSHFAFGFTIFSFRR